MFLVVPFGGETNLVNLTLLFLGWNGVFRERLHELKKGLFSALKLSGLLHTGPKLELKKRTLKLKFQP